VILTPLGRNFLAKLYPYLGRHEKSLTKAMLVGAHAS